MTPQTIIPASARQTPSSSRPAEEPPRAAHRPEDYVRRILQADDFPALSRQMGELMASLNEGEASAQRLANLVLRDYALTVKVIRTANTVHYNRTGRPVQSATQAMMLLGARTVRDLAGELLLFEHYRKRSPGLKELMLLSLLTAGHAREAAVRLGLGDPEAAQLDGMFRNLGEVLVAAHLQAEYASILRITGQGGAGESRRARDAAALKVLGCSFEDVGVAIAGDWGMPEHVCRGMRATGQGGEDALELVTAFAHDLTVAIHRADPPAARQGIAVVLETYGRRLQLSRDVLASIADAAVAATRETFTSAGVALDDLRLERQITAALNDREKPAGAASDAPDARPAAAPAAPAAGAAADAAEAGDPVDGTAVPADASPAGAPPTTGAPLAALRDRLALEVETAAADAPLYDLHRLLLVALEAGLRGGPFERVFFCAPDPRVTELRARLGLGAGSEALLPRLRIPVTPPGSAFGAALLRGEEVFVGAGYRPSAGASALLRGTGATSAGMLPVIVDGLAIGCLYFDRTDRASASAPIEPSALAYMRRLAAAVTKGVAVRRAGAPAAAAAAPARPAAAADPARPASPLLGESAAAIPADAAGAPDAPAAARPGGVDGATSPGPLAPAGSAGSPDPAGSPAPAAVPAPGGAVAALHSAEVKAVAVVRLLRGEAVAALSAELGVPAADLEAWQREFLAGALARLTAS